jgi:hypothetical protein
MSNGTAGGVRSLLAMFENNNSEPASPDVRGRSPGGARSNGHPSRPLSKVRTNFVSVEPLKGARNDTPEQRESTGPHRRESFSLNENRPSDAEALSEIKKTVSQELELRRSNNSIVDLVPENAIASEAPTPFTAGEKQLGMPTETTTVPSVTSTSVSRATSESRPDTQALDSSPPVVQPAKEQRSGFSPSPRVIRNLAENLRNTPKPAEDTAEKREQPPPTPTPHPKRANSTKVEQKPEQTARGSDPVEQEEPTLFKETATKVGVERVGKAKSRVSSGTVTTGGFVKPKPRSPTRPVKLPAHLIAPTASSAAKHGSTPPQPPRTLSRRSSTISTASHRPSIRPSHPPPLPRSKQPALSAERPPPAPKSPTAPSSFLERMMRPTASSASKVKDKVDHTTKK